MRNYDKYKALMGKITDVYHTIALMHWDSEVNMPAGAAEIRSRQIGTMTGIGHEMATSKETGVLIDSLLVDNNLTPDERRNVEISKKDYDKQIKLKHDFVVHLAAAKSKAFSLWTKAKSTNDFPLFAPSLEELVKLKREETEIRGYQNEPYDALLDLYEPGLTTGTLDHVFSQARDEIVPFIAELSALPKPRTDFLGKHYDKDEQWDFGIDILKSMGYDMNTGRQDISAHPFTVNFAPTDVRVTTRIDENDLLNMTWSCIHEGGHALYEQGLPVSQYGLPLCEAVSLSIHESQSRLWENHVGRSRVFWEYWFPKLQERFPKNLGDISLDTFYRGINTIAPNLIRTEADELHYHLHVIVRYEIERACMNGEIEAKDLPRVWNEKYKEYMNIDVPDDVSGVLQDVHWSHGSFGYFPTYTLGSFYAAQFFHTAQNEINGIASSARNGNYTDLLSWLRENIHQHGRKYDPEDLCRRVTGESLNVKYFMEYVKTKFRDVYRS